MSTAPAAWDSAPSAEWVLEQVDRAGSSGVQDSRTLVEKPPTPSDEAQVESYHKARADWQLHLLGHLKSLEAREMLTIQSNEEAAWTLTAEGSQLARDGSQEARVWAALPPGGEEGKSLEELKAQLGADVLKIGQGKAFAKKWARKHPSVPGALARMPGVDAIQDETAEDLRAIQKDGTLDNEKKLADLKKRKLAVQKKLLWFSIAKGANFSLTIQKLATDLSADMLQSGRWKDVPFKKYNFDAEGTVPDTGALHPLLKVREEFRNIFFEMGFTEMPTNRFVDSSFWCFDSLFVPQQHAARDLQDTFFIKDPPRAKSIPEDYLRRVTAAHENGGEYGSTGYGYKFSREVTEKLVLRTHTTAVSAAMLFELANRPGGFKPAKMFSIDRVFRNEAVDATHLAEFHQVEGVVADYNITLGDLIGFMQIFFAKMGVTNLRFKPAYNPYTEPSLEIFSYHQGLKKWVEIGNSGMFRPEMLRPMGLPDGVNVLGWGLSLERPTMIRYGINNIRDLVGHKISIENVEKAAAVRFP
ncbi:unnamed protein product [Parajaminaea phylloscopi]